MTDIDFLDAVATLARTSGAIDLAAEATMRRRALQRARRLPELRWVGDAVLVAGVRHKTRLLGAALAAAALGRPGDPTPIDFFVNGGPNTARNRLRDFADWLDARGHHDLAATVRAIKVFGDRRPLQDGAPDPLAWSAVAER
ncbi:hypothetical protein [Rubrivivax albus]|uniref:Uncharacterized protein n=1 Tax=Rubrivivax albus TaxID=2499835 RepID=A0A437K0R0_9BURK|nr:hypothetical protein [Rubrivivax albus]RVT53967.1 hypothetical protein ENE75_03565 [Rubrivivax albus]